MKKSNKQSSKRKGLNIPRPNVAPGGSMVNKTGGWRTNRPEINYQKCISCESCVKLCPDSCLIMKKIGSKKKPIIDYNYCKGCGLCAKECPVKAIKMTKDYQ